MPTTRPTQHIADLLADRLGGRWTLRALHASGFCDTWEAASAGGRCFVKSLPAARAGVLDAEADGLRALAAAQAVRVPAVVGWLVLNRGGLDVFVHPNTGDALVDHRDRAVWLGRSYALNLAALAG